MATTTNFGWETPDDTDLVKDGAAAIRTALGGVDTSFVDLKGGTTGQVLSKASNTDLDFSWVAQDDSNAIQNAIVDAKGDLIAATGADTPARLAVGTNGQFLTADSTAATGLAWSTVSTGGGYTLLSTTTLSSSSTTISSISGSYKHLFIQLNNMTSTSNGDQVYFRFNGDTANNYHFGEFRCLTTTVTGNTTTDAFQQVLARVPTTTTAAKAGGAAVWLYRYTDTTRVYGTSQAYGYVDSTGGYTGQYVFNYDCSAAISSITVISGAGTLSGTVYIYGVN